MGCCEPRSLARVVLRVAVTCIAGATAAGCGFHPVYGNATLAGTPGAATALATVEVNEIAAPNGSPLARIAFEVRNRLLFHLTGGAAPAPPAYRLNVTVSGSAESLIVDINSGRPDTQDYSLNASYTAIQPISRVDEGVAPPHPSQIRMCRFPASGSSWESLARGGVDDTIRDSLTKKVSKVFPRFRSCQFS